MNSRVLMYFLILTLSLNSCISEYKANLPKTDFQILVVEGNIIENSELSFYLSKGFSLEEDVEFAKFNIDNATFFLIGSNGYKSEPSTYMGNGTYKLLAVKFEDNVEYGIEISYNGDTYRSKLSKPVYTPEIDSVTWVQQEKYGLVSFRVSTTDKKGEARFFIWDYVENWETTATFRTTIFYNPVDNSYSVNDSAPFYYCWKRVVSQDFIIGSTESLSDNVIINKPIFECISLLDRFSQLYCITVNQRAISKGAFEYYQNKILLNNRMGGLFTPQPAELGGNIICVTDPAKKSMGYVEVIKNVTQKRLFIERGDITYKDNSAFCEAIEHGTVLSIIAERKISLADFYKWDNYRPAGDKDLMASPILPLMWAPEYCTNCLRNGGSKNKPDFWPNDHK